MPDEEKTFSGSLVLMTSRAHYCMIMHGNEATTIMAASFHGHTRSINKPKNTLVILTSY